MHLKLPEISSDKKHFHSHKPWIYKNHQMEYWVHLNICRVPYYHWLTSKVDHHYTRRFNQHLSHHLWSDSHPLAERFTQPWRARYACRFYQTYREAERAAATSCFHGRWHREVVHPPPTGRSGGGDRHWGSNTRCVFMSEVLSHCVFRYAAAEFHWESLKFVCCWKCLQRKYNYLSINYTPTKQSNHQTPHQLTSVLKPVETELHSL